MFVYIKPLLICWPVIWWKNSISRDICLVIVKLVPMLKIAKSKEQWPSNVQLNYNTNRYKTFISLTSPLNILMSEYKTISVQRPTQMNIKTDSIKYRLTIRKTNQTISLKTKRYSLTLIILKLASLAISRDKYLMNASKPRNYKRVFKVQNGYYWRLNNSLLRKWLTLCMVLRTIQMGNYINTNVGLL